VATNTGRYVVTGLQAGSYLIAPTAEAAVFVLSNRLVSVGPDAMDVNFTSYRSNALTMERLTGDRLRAVFAGHAGEVWRVWDATNLVDWTVCSTNTVESSGLFELLLTNSPQPALRFLKAAQP
jgi:hypothetical protein